MSNTLIHALVSDFVSRLDGSLRGKPHSFMDILHPDISVFINGTTPISGTFKTLAIVRDVLLPSLNERIEDGAVEIADVIQEEDRLATFLKLQITSRTGLLYNEKNDLTGCMFTVKDNKISEIQFFPDTTLIETILFERRFVADTVNKGKAVT